MTGVLTVMWKEARDLLGERHSMRGTLVQSLIFLAMMGVFLPLGEASAWIEGQPLAILWWFILPATLAATLAADAFAGERERHTLETLLAAPIDERAILCGKAATAIGFAVAVSLIAIGVAALTVNLTVRPPTPFVPSARLWLGAAGAALGTAGLSAVAAIAISMRVAVARSAQQMASFLSMGIFGAVTVVWIELKLPFDWHTVLKGEVLLIALSGLALMAAVRMFQTDRFFERR